MQAAIDIHAHMLCPQWLELFRAHGGKRFDIRRVASGREVVHHDGIPFMTPESAMFDLGARLARMDEAGVDMAVLSLTGPNVYWGDEAASTAAARAINDAMAQAQRSHPRRLRWMASLPFQYPRRAVEELERALDQGAVGVMTLANVGGESQTDARFAPVWEAIDRHALPVLVHPTVPPGAAQMDMVAYQLSASVGFMFDTTLALARMIYDGFLDRHPNLKLVVAHGGATLPFLAARLDRCHEQIAAARAKIARPPTEYLRRIHVDTVVYSQAALQMCVETFGERNVLYGSDSPHNIGDMAGCLARVDALPAEQRDLVRGGNAGRLFGL